MDQLFYRQRRALINSIDLLYSIKTTVDPIVVRVQKSASHAA